ncbi:serine/threonine-protein kinase RIO2 [Haloarcula marismortui]|jgi:RIO kinase 2|uniref:non-specific serine/threonine protein kinase n=2 Tax=Haloarcula marismortui TaxID=2238 RepID=Q5V0R0_HALMA|nr:MULTISPECIES: serine/threonine-protein kinase RIO2 [Haloarcula]AAV46893.1 serine/threonine protein kinase [Haloarcula marismortui ATCC 43049]EMA20385.1 serine/threonine protein kinase [Haloarcula californiae ATCC 33799]QCP91598.1 serine/threonine protein phosphatase [Haloarcula marismortui ATCC 43049]
MVQNVASVMAELEPEDFHLLSGVEQGMRFSEYVAREKLTEFSRLTTEDVDYRLDRCADRGLVERKTIQYEGFKLTFEGYDTLALHTFAERDTIEGVGSPLGVGKESDVYEAQSYKPVALKYHREGYTNFREVMKEREYTADRDHVSWLYTARKAAEREYDALETLYPNVSVPQPIDTNRHAIVMEKIDGVELSRTKLETAQVLPILDLVLEEMQTAYREGYVHADMSEYNVFVTNEGVVVFDWPQAVPTDHENARELLTRDVENIVSYFERKYPQEISNVDRDAVAERLATDAFDSITEFTE